MTESAPGVLERPFDCLIAGDWTGNGALLSADAKRIGPWGDRLVGRERVVEMMAASIASSSRDDIPGTTWDIHRIVSMRLMVGQGSPALPRTLPEARFRSSRSHWRSL